MQKQLAELVYKNAEQRQQYNDVFGCSFPKLRRVFEPWKVTQQTAQWYYCNNGAHWLKKGVLLHTSNTPFFLVIYLKSSLQLCMTSLQTSWSFLTSQDTLHCCTVRDKEFRSPQQEKHSSSGAWGDLWGSLHRQCLVYFLCSRFLSEVVLNSLHLDGFKHRLTVKGVNEKRQAQQDLQVVCVNGFLCVTRGH